jgi:hypothetical protein
VLVGFTSTVGNSAGIIAPLVVGALTSVDVGDADTFWRLYLSGWQQVTWSQWVTGPYGLGYPS